MFIYKLIISIFLSSFLISDPFTNSDIKENNFGFSALDQTVDPNTYIVGPGDTFLLSMVTSSQVKNETLLVSPIGDVLIPLVGKVNVDKISLDDAFKLIKLECRKRIPDSIISLTLVSIKDFKILVIGPKNIPTGYKVVNSSTRLLDVFTEINSVFKKDTLAIHDISSRNIVINKGGDNRKIYDLEKYKIDGLQSNNPYLHPGDVLELKYVKNYISINGAIMVPGHYEFRDGDDLFDIINLCGGFTDNLAIMDNNIEVLRYVDDSNYENLYLSINPEIANSFKLKPYDQILVKPKSDYKRGKTITIAGEIMNPGVYSIGVDANIKNIIQRSGGYTVDADSNKIIINNEVIDKIGDKELNRILALNPEDRSDVDLSYIRARARSQRGSFSNSDFDLQNSKISEHKLFDKDIILVPKKYNFIEVIGAVRNPGRYTFNGNLTIDEYIQQSGGITKNATNKYFIIQSSTGDRLDSKKAKDYNLKSQDIIFVEEKNDYNSWDRFKDFVEVSSQIFTILAVFNGLNN